MAFVDHHRKGLTLVLSVLLACALLVIPPMALADECDTAADQTTQTDGAPDTGTTQEPAETETPADPSGGEGTDDPAADDLASDATETEGEEAEDPEATDGEEDAEPEEEAEEPVIPERTVEDGKYYLCIPGTVRQVMDVAGARTTDQANVQIYDAKLANNQKWRIVYDEETGYYTITNVNSGKLLDVAGGKPVSGKNVQQFSANGGLNQQWEIVANEDGTYTIKSAMSADELELVLDRAGAKTANNTNVQIYTATGADNQKWSFRSTVAPVVGTEDADTSLADGWYVISSSANGSLVVDIAGASTATANAQLHTAGGGSNQMFKLVRTGSFYTIQPGCSTMMLEAVDGNPFPGTNVQQNTADNSAKQQWKLVSLGNGAYRLINRASGAALEVSGSVQSGAILQTDDPSDRAAQSFVFTPKTDFLAEGTYNIRFGTASKYLDVAGGRTGNGENVQIYDGNGGQNQKWVATKVGTNTYTFRNVKSGKYLCLVASGNGANVCQSDSGATEWTVEPNAGGLRLVNVAYGTSLDVAGGRTANQTNVQAYAENSSAAQRFTFVSTNVLSSGLYTVKLASNPSLVLDVAGAKADDGKNVQLYKSNNGNNQKWFITANGDGTYTMVCALSNKATDVMTSGNVQQYTSNGGANQKWKVLNNEDGTFSLESVQYAGQVLTVAAASSGSNVSVSANTGAASQKFVFASTSMSSAVNGGAKASASMNAKAIQQQSNTNYLIMVDRGNFRIGVYTGRYGAWICQKCYPCCTGMPGYETPTGSFTVVARGSYFGDKEGYRCWWWTRFSTLKNTMFHSIKYYAYDYPYTTARVLDGRMSQRVSHGCLRMYIEDAKWIHDTIPNGTKVVVYN